MKLLKHHLLKLLTTSIITIIGYLSYEKYTTVQILPFYSLDESLTLTKNPKNKPLILELYRLGAQVRHTQSPSQHDIMLVSNTFLPPQPPTTVEHPLDAQILLTRLCKDSCRALRCRIDPGLGHACRVNCPRYKIRACRLAIKL